MIDQRGFTLIELMVVVAITAILLAIAAPSFTDLIARRRVEGVATEVNTDLQYARTEAVSRGANVSLFVPSGGTSYCVTTGTDCSTTLKNIALPTGVSISEAASSALTITYDALRGWTNNSTDIALTFQSSNTSGKLRVSVNSMGRVALCSPSSSLTGYVAC